MEKHRTALEEQRAALEVQRAALEKKHLQAETRKTEVEEKLLQQKQVKLRANLMLLCTVFKTPVITAVAGPVLLAWLAQEMEQLMQDLKDNADDQAMENAEMRYIVADELRTITCHILPHLV